MDTETMPWEPLAEDPDDGPDGDWLHPLACWNCRHRTPLAGSRSGTRGSQGGHLDAPGP